MDLGTGSAPEGPPIPTTLEFCDLLPVPHPQLQVPPQTLNSFYQHPELLPMLFTPPPQTLNSSQNLNFSQHPELLFNCPSTISTPKGESDISSISPPPLAGFPPCPRQDIPPVPAWFSPLSQTVFPLDPDYFPPLSQTVFPPGLSYFSPCPSLFSPHPSLFPPVPARFPPDSPQSTPYLTHYLPAVHGRQRGGRVPVLVELHEAVGIIASCLRQGTGGSGLQSRDQGYKPGIRGINPGLGTQTARD